MFELYEIPPHIKPNWQVWYECVLPEIASMPKK